MNYRISVKNDDYFRISNKIISKNICVEGNSISFDTDKNSIEILDNLNIMYMVSKNKKSDGIKKIKDNTGFLIGIIIILFLLFINSYRVSDIKFNNTYPINEEITEYINKDMKELLWFKFHKNNYDSISKDLRRTFYQYEWISIYRKNDLIMVEIIEEGNKHENISVGVGPIYAKTSGIIDSYQVYSGNFIMHIGDYIKEGDLLIEGDEAKGYVMCYTYYEKNIKINKEEHVITKENEKDNYYSVSFFNFKGFNIGKNNDYSLSDKHITKTFTIPYLLKINKIEETKESDIIKVYSKYSGEVKAKDIIYEEFKKNKLLNKEEILRCELLCCKEYEDYYSYSFLVKSLISVGRVENEIKNGN